MTAPPPSGSPLKYPAWVYVAAAIFVIAILVSPRFRAFVLDDTKGEAPAVVEKTSPRKPAPAPADSSPEASAPAGDAASQQTEVATEESPASSPMPEAGPRSSTGPLGKFRKPATDKSEPNEPPPARDAGTAKTSPNPNPNPTGAPPSKTAAGPASGPPLGELTEIRKGVLRSTAGLVYRRGSVDGHRLDHVLEHAEDNPDKPLHGVFLGKREEILAVIDEAYQIALKRGPPTVQKEKEGDRTVYLVDMKRKIGYLGGQVGNRKNHPPCRLLRLVLEGDEVITAFPTDR